ncbi:DNA repair protein RecO [Stappia sp. F7233]|uniref:DNA repair protein RecO n=1 Tax=Stappia albiluteola TaxID=2758565 RepID=A0A839ABX9_9HYPH|nr:DNA repair protein RecO [Stappia albiluteola]MBA5776635.1 DNA repair protein RecO [Stappia albiluteola]
MEWAGEGVILGCRRHGENDVIVEAMTRERGRHLGLVRGGRSRRHQASLQPGNKVGLVWRARLDGHLGNYAVEPVRLRAAELMESAIGIYAIQALAALLRLLPERDPHPALYDALEVVLDHLENAEIAGALAVRFELQVLNELGFGLDLSQCAATGRREDLVFVSPKSGRAVSRDAGAPYADRMLPLPAFLLATGAEPRQADGQAIGEAFRMTGFFLHRYVWEPRGIQPSDAREGLIQAVLRASG